MIFAKCNIVIGADGRTVGPNQRIPDDTDPELVKELIARGFAFHVDSKAVTEPAKPPAPPAGGLVQGQWAFDPKSIENDSLDTLNMKILGHVERFGLAKVDPFTDEAEARVFMSLEWGK